MSRRAVVDPGGTLGEIVARKRIDVAARFAGVSLGELRGRAEPTSRSLRAALARPGMRFILEVKRASPSAGSLRAEADPAAIARGYAPVADAISVLTDGPFFGGSTEDLARVRAVFDGPILAKDFFLDPRQVVEARLGGADAILVMLSLLDDGAAAMMIEEARRLGMDSLIEAHDAGEVERAVALSAPVIGINNRDLRTLEVDLGTTGRLAARIPADRVVVAESGVSDRRDVESLAPFADAVLVGTALIRSSDPGAAARALVYGRVKVCGITTSEDLAAAHSAGASMAGLVMVAGTPRHVTPGVVARLAKDAPLPLVGVFRDADAPLVARCADELGLAAVQLHGGEDERYVSALRPALPRQCELWAAVPVDEGVPTPREGADRLLFDSVADGRSGGTGTAFDWSLIAGHSGLASGLLAGGLTPANARAASRVGAYALDVGSGVEASPGTKDPAKLAAFFEALRPTCRTATPC